MHEHILRQVIMLHYESMFTMTINHNLFNNYLLKVRWIFFNNPWVEVEGIIQQYSLSLWPVIVNCSINVQLLLNSVFLLIPFYYNCFDYSYQDKLPVLTRIYQVYIIQLAKRFIFFFWRVTPNLVAFFAFLKIVFCAIVFITPCLTFTKCKLTISKCCTPAIITTCKVKAVGHDGILDKSKLASL